MPRTVAVLVVVVSLGVAGCSLFAEPESGVFPPTDQGCLTDTVPRPAGLESAGNLTPASYPDPPSTANKTAIEAFVIGFEHSYYNNTLLETHQDDALGVDRVIIEYSNTSVRTHSDGYIVAFQAGGAVYYTDGSIGDIEAVPVEYFLNETAVLRDDGGMLRDDGGSTDARNGTILVRC